MTLKLRSVSFYISNVPIRIFKITNICLHYIFVGQNFSKILIFLLHFLNILDRIDHFLSVLTDLSMNALKTLGPFSTFLLILCQPLTCFFQHPTVRINSLQFIYICFLREDIFSKLFCFALLLILQPFVGKDTQISAGILAYIS